MNAKLSFRFLLAIIIITSLACSLTNLTGFQKLETGPIQTFTLNEPYPGIDAVQDVTLSMVVGEFTLSGGTEALIEGEVRYNIKEWKPTIENKGNSLTISQGDPDLSMNGFPGEDVVNVWDLKLGNIPMNLVVIADTYEASLDLSGLPIQSLVVQDGASDSTIRFGALNPVEMQEFAYQTGASEIAFLGLANANFSQMSFDGGVGEYTFDFSGDLQRDAAVNIEAGLSNVRIIVPEGTATQVLTGDGMNNIDVTDTWNENGGKYVNDGKGPRLTIIVDVGAGELHLSNK